jgi:hypothetical protein
VAGPQHADMAAAAVIAELEADQLAKAAKAAAQGGKVPASEPLEDGHDMLFKTSTIRAYERMTGRSTGR